MNSAEKPHWDADSSVRSVLRRSPVFRISKPFLSKFITPSSWGRGRSPRLSHRRSGRETRRPPSPHRSHAVARKGDRRRSVAGPAARDDAGAGALLGGGVRLAQVRGEAEGPPALHHRDRWAGHSFHSRSFET